jgi:hypothetical protein
LSLHPPDSNVVGSYQAPSITKKINKTEQITDAKIDKDNNTNNTESLKSRNKSKVLVSVKDIQ